jgi:transposase-like protein
LEVIKGEKTIQDIAMLYQVHPDLIAFWEKQLLEHAAMLFEQDGKDKEAEAASQKEEELYRPIGQLQGENEFLKNTSNGTGPKPNARA